MFCRFCGKKILDDSLFCPYCGKYLEEKLNNDSIPTDAVRTPAVSAALHDDEYYKNQASKMAGSTLISVSTIFCYAALIVFLFFNIKMAPSYGQTKFLIYVVTGAAAIGLVVIFRKKILPGNSKPLYVLTLILSVIVISASIGLRIVYEAKVDTVTAQIPSSGDILVSLEADTEYYSSSGEGYIDDPYTNIKIGDDLYNNGDKFTVSVGKSYPIKVGIGHLDAGSYANSTILFSEDTFSNGQYSASYDVVFSRGRAEMATATLTFTRFCTFWDVIFY